MSNKNYNIKTLDLASEPLKDDSLLHLHANILRTPNSEPLGLKHPCAHTAALPLPPLTTARSPFFSAFPLVTYFIQQMFVKSMPSARLNSDAKTIRISHSKLGCNQGTDKQDRRV